MGRVGEYPLAFCHRLSPCLDIASLVTVVRMPRSTSPPGFQIYIQGSCQLGILYSIHTCMQ
jgi:hypothetical protein